MIHGFSYVARPDSQVLILGSMPGAESLRQQKYYAHPRNAFWPIMGEILGFSPESPYEGRITALLKARIALWDVLQACERQGSLDHKISVNNRVVNDFASFFDGHRRLKAIFCNGRKAYDIFQRQVYSRMTETPATCQITALPSTSPAHAGLTRNEKLAQWMAIKAFLPDL